MSRLAFNKNAESLTKKSTKWLHIHYGKFKY